MGTVNQVNITDCFYVGSVDATAGGLPPVTLGTQGTTGKQKGKMGNTGNKRAIHNIIDFRVCCRTQGTLGTMETQLGTHSKHTENNREK